MTFCGLSRLFRRRRSKSKKNKNGEKPCAPPSYSAESPPPSYNEKQAEPESVQPAQPEAHKEESDHVFFMLDGNSVKRLTPREYEAILIAARARHSGGGVDIDPNNRLLFFRYGDKELSNKVKTTFSCSNGARGATSSDYVKSLMNVSSVKGKKELHPLVTETEVQGAKRKELMRKIQEEEEFFVSVPWTEYMGDVAEIRRFEEEGCEPKKKFPSWNTVWAVVPEKDIDDPRYTKNTAPSVMDVPIY
ncbi:hypothetical protein EX30DRAFT_399198 [Ascodesmis nigricans]|uniref:Uncharacterized protein n=1 Tax=Ascodesmis nigricans TaxID=341454 RepID=A0A4S2MIJ5_9PEZI|nr:hypothetical protein EX30DRAFT_399198 [Ascodesmis nigricans]